MWRPHGHAHTNPERPEAYAVCDRCGLLYNHRDLKFQFEWRGTQLMNTGLLVCTRTCYDKPFIFYRPIILPPDPVPILNARPENYVVEDEGGVPGPTPLNSQFELDVSPLDGGEHL